MGGTLMNYMKVLRKRINDTKHSAGHDETRDVHREAERNVYCDAERVVPRDAERDVEPDEHRDVRHDSSRDVLCATASPETSGSSDISIQSLDMRTLTVQEIKVQA